MDDTPTDDLDAEGYFCICGADFETDEQWLAHLRAFHGYVGD